MLNYIFKRILIMVPVLWGLVTIVFLTMFVLIPGDPARLLLGQHGDEKTIEFIKKKYGLDQPLHIQYGIFLKKTFQGDLGYSYRKKQPVIKILMDRYPATIKLAFASIIIASVIGILAGIFAALNHNKLIDGFIMVFSLLGISTPVFWLGMMFIVVFASWLKLFPTYGYGDSGGFRYLFLPALSLSALSIGTIARYTRSSILEILQQDYIRTAYAKGLPFSQIIFKHTLKNAMIPIITVIGMNFASLLGGAVATEYVFSWPGIGKLLVDSIKVRDIPVVEGGIIFLGLSFLIINLIVDITYTYFNPKIRYEKEKKL